MKCDRCDKPAVHHVTDVEGSVGVARHLCGECGKGEFPMMPVGPGSIAVARLSPEMLKCSRCGAETAVVTCVAGDLSLDRSTRPLKLRGALCAGCAEADGVKYSPVGLKVGEVALVIQE